MPRHSRKQSCPTPAPLVPLSLSPGLTDDQVSRWADLIADGRGDFPDDLSGADRERLLVSVRQRLRRRLVQFIARAVAVQLHRTDRPDGETPHA